MKMSHIFQIESDLHLEFRITKRKFSLHKYLIRKKDARFLILAGDTCPVKLYEDTWQTLLQYCSLTFEQTFFVTGNHEYYDSSRDYVDKKLRELSSLHGNVHFLQRDVYRFADNGPILLGCTLWSQTIRPIPRMADYSCIYKDNMTTTTPTKREYITHEETLQWHLEDQRWLEETLSVFSQQTLLTSVSPDIIVITHHLPSRDLIAARYIGDADNIAFASDLDHLCQMAKVWVCGHTHVPKITYIKGCYVVINPRGYPGETTYRPLVVTVAAKSETEAKIV